MDPLDELSARQRELLASWLPGFDVVADHSWGLVSTRVLEIEHDGARYIAKAAAPNDSHIVRELHAHREWVPALGEFAPRLVHSDEAARLLLTTYLPGRLVLDSPAQQSPETFRQAGALLSRYHSQTSRTSDDFARLFRERALRNLDSEHRIDAGVERAARAEVETWPDETTTLVPTHGDWQPRNWLTDDGTIRIIDFGRSDWRWPEEDFTRQHRQDFESLPALEAPFLEGYGSDPRSPERWRRALLAEAIGTAVWAYQVGDEPFEQQGHRMLAQLLDER